MTNIGVVAANLARDFDGRVLVCLLELDDSRDLATGTPGKFSGWIGWLSRPGWPSSHLGVSSEDGDCRDHSCFFGFVLAKSGFVVS